MLEKTIILIASVFTAFLYDFLPARTKAKLNIVFYIFLLAGIVIGGVYGIHQAINYDSYIFLIMVGVVALFVIIVFAINKGCDKAIDYLGDETVSPKVRRRRDIMFRIIFLLILAALLVCGIYLYNGVMLFVW